MPEQSLEMCKGIQKNNTKQGKMYNFWHPIKRLISMQIRKIWPKIKGLPRGKN